MNQRRKVYRVRQLTLVCVVVSLALLTSCSPSSQPAITGSWTGTVHQPGHSLYSVEMTITAIKLGQPAGTVTYPELNCGGTIRCEGISDGHITLRESILTDRDRRCVDGVKIVLTVGRTQPPRATIAFFMPDGSPAGTAELKRVDAR